MGLKIIGHRGVRGVELENSLSSFRAAMRSAADAIEFDIHRTRDGKLVVIHDDKTGRVAKQNVRISDVTFNELRRIELKNGQTIPTLNAVLDIAGSRELYIDIKDKGCIEELLRILKQHPEVQPTFISRHASELKKIRELIPNAPTYIYFLKTENIVPRPIKWVRIAQDIQATGIGLNKLFLNPITYNIAMRAGLKIYAYPINSAWLASLILFCYPRLDIITDHPDKLNKLRRGK